MKKIPLSQGKFALVDDADYEWLNKWKWYYAQGYAVRHSTNPKENRKLVFMHNIIVPHPKGLITDHVDRNKLNNSKANLRLATKADNARNRKKRKDNTTGFIGVVAYKRVKNGKKWHAQIESIDGDCYSLGYWKTAKDAALAYDKKAKELFGKFAELNFP